MILGIIGLILVALGVLIDCWYFYFMSKPRAIDRPLAFGNPKTIAVALAISVLFLLCGWLLIKTDESMLKKLESFESFISQSRKNFQNRNIQKDSEDAKILEQVIEIVSKGEKPSKELTIKAKAMGREFLKKYGPTASDDAVIEYWKISLLEVSKLQKINPALCIQAIFQRNLKSWEFLNFLSDELLEKEVNAFNGLLISSINYPQQVPTREEVEIFFKKTLVPMEKKFGNDLNLLGQLESPDLDKSKVCNISIFLIEEILKLPKKESSIVLRGLMGGLL